MVKKTKKDCCEDQSTKYPYHGAEIRHINRAIGQLEGIKKMIEERRYCTEIMALLSSVRGSIKSVESNIMETYLDSCVTKAFRQVMNWIRNKKSASLKKYLRSPALKFFTTNLAFIIHFSSMIMTLNYLTFLRRITKKFNLNS